MINAIYRTLANKASPGGDNGKLQIFIFHRVLHEPDPLMPEEPDRERFHRIAKIISSVFQVIPLDEAVELFKEKSLPPRAACITFDDGYLDNYTNALPILKEYGLPFTVFVATDFMDGSMMWNDIVIESIRNHSGKVSLQEIGLTDFSCDTVEDKYSTINNIISRIKHLPQNERESLVSELVDKTNFESFRLMMRPDEVVSMRKEGVTIGAHTCSHPILSLLDNQQAKEEIRRGKEILESLLDESVDFFAYPNGRPEEDYLKRDVEIVKELGFKGAVSTSKRIANVSDSIFELPRFTPWDANISKFILRCIKSAL